VKFYVFGNKANSIKNQLRELLPEQNGIDTHSTLDETTISSLDDSQATLAIVDEQEHENNKRLLETAQQRCPIFECILVIDDKLEEDQLKASMGRIALKKEILTSMKEIQSKAYRLETRICTWPAKSKMHS
jgi:hypothetical protein